MTLAELIRARDQLKAARAGGVSAAAHGDTRIEFKSDREMAAALAALEAEINTLTRGDRPRTFYPLTSKGL